MSIEEWIKKRTFHHSIFWDLKNLVKVKEKKGFKISLCFPTLNEEKTIGKEIIVMKSELQDRYSLIDEIAVIDSGSEDHTREIAQDLGVKVFLASDHLSNYGTARGKGENLWKSIYLLEGDIIVYLDADISNIHPKFAYALLAPIIYDSDIKFVKAFYERPLSFSKKIRPSGGGRVTEILIRPLFSQFFPELSGTIQPLSGEFAGFREVFENIPFSIGYGIETGMLIDIYMKYGLYAIAQIDLDQRIHRNQETVALGRMAHGIMQTFWKKLELYKEVTGLDIDNYLLRQINNDNDNYIFNEFNIREIERPPMIGLKEYRKKRGLKQIK